MFFLYYYLNKNKHVFLIFEKDGIFSKIATSLVANEKKNRIAFKEYIKRHVVVASEYV